MAHRAPDDATQDVAALLVRRHDAVVDEERHRPGVIGEDPQRDVRVASADVLVPGAGDSLGFRDQRTEDVDLPDRVDALDDRELPLEAGAGVDARLPERGERAVRLGVELHEHEVPDLDVAVLARAPGPLRGRLGTEVPEDLRGGPARAGVGHAPEVGVAQALDPLGRQPDRVAPDRLGLVVRRRGR